MGLGKRNRRGGLFAPGGVLRAAVAALLVFAFALTALPAEMHRHAAAAPVAAAGAADHASDACATAAAAADDAVAFSPSDCGLCDFAAALVSPAVEVAPPAALPHLTGAPAASLPLRAQPYRPYRFADRSSSRGPPAAAPLHTA